MTPLKVLVTAGATEVPIDRVRAITNIFKGRTGTEIALCIAHGSPDDPDDREAYAEGELAESRTVTLLTSNEEMVLTVLRQRYSTATDRAFVPQNLRIVPYRTFDELAALMEREVRTDEYDVIIHSAAVSDYRVAGVHMRGDDGDLVPLDASGKVGSSYERLFLELERTPKLLEQIRGPWGFTGKLVQFKLEIGITDEELISRARTALERSGGDLCVANCLEWAKEAALLVDRDGRVERVDRAKLPAALVRRFS